MTPRGAQEVLIIEDDQKIAAAAERCLLGIGLSPRVLRGRDLVSVFEHHDPALLIVAAEVTISYYGRQLDGLAVLREVRARGTLPGILLIGLGSATLVGQLSPHESFVMKPFADEQLRHTVQGLLRSPGTAIEPTRPTTQYALQQIAHILAQAGILSADQASAVQDLPALDTLSKREAEVLQALRRSQRVPTIAKSLSITAHTVRNHLKSIYAKLGVHSQAELLELVSPKHGSSSHTGLRAKATARSGDALFDAIFNLNPIAMGIRRLRDDMVVATNPAFARLFGRQLAMGDMVGDLGAIIEPRGRAVTLAKAARREPQRNIESQLRDSSGRIRDVLMSVHYLEIDGEDCSLGSWVDVTERTQPSETTRDREARFAAVFHQTSDVMLLLAVGADGVLRVDAANRRFVERISHVTKVDEADLIGLTLEQLTLDVYKLSREVLAQHQASIQRAIDTRAPVTFEDSINFASKPLVAEVSLTPILDATGTPRYVSWRSRTIASP